MGYLVSKYQHLFPQGTFDAPKVIKTWSESHRLFAQNQKREKKTRQALAPGLTLEKGHIAFSKGGFSNYRSFEIDPQKRKTQVIFFNRGEFPLKTFQKTPGLKLLNTLGYFYFTTNLKADKVSPPQIKVNNLFVFEGQLLQLPVTDRSALIIFKNGQVRIPFIQAKGTLKIGSQNLRWRGAKTLEKNFLPNDELVVYTGSAGKILPYEDPIIGPGRLAKKVLTPKNRVDLVISLRSKKLQVVEEIKEGGTEVTRGLMIFSSPKTLIKKVKKGEIISEVTLDTLNLADISEAVSVGPQIFLNPKRREKQLLAEGLDNDESLCNQPHRERFKLARSFLVKLKDGHLVSLLIDGIPQAGNIYPGVTPQEAADFIWTRYPDAEEVVATDPGGTMKVVYRDNGKVSVFGNIHYLDYRYHRDGTLDFWPNGLLGRKAVTFLGVF